MALGDSSQFERDTLFERLAGARWVLAAAVAGLGVAAWFQALTPLAAALIGLLVLMGAALPVRRRVVEAALPRPSGPSRPAPVVNRLPDLVRAFPEAALLLDSRGMVVATNAAAGRLLANVRVGDPVSFAVRVPEVIEALRACAADGDARRIEFLDRVPVDRWLRVDIVPIRPQGRESGPTESILLNFVDLTPQRRVEQMRVDFIANASHELRTPLASLSGFIETLQGPARNDANARERFLKIMGEQARRMSRLIDDLLSLSRIELKMHLRPEEEVDLGAVLSHVCDGLTPLGRERGIEIVFDPPATPLKVRGDRDELIRVFENLVENGLKYGASGKRVDIVLAREGADAVTSVRDYGPGIEAEHVPRLTERFYRVDTAHSREQGGTGLGLAIVKHIVARHRGKLGIESVPGEGATFSVRLSVCSEK